MEKNLTDAPTSERPGQDNADVLIILPGQDTADVLQDDQTELSDKIKSIEISQGNSELDKDNSDGNINESGLSEPRGQMEKLSDNIKHDNLGQMDASMDHESKSQESTLSNDIKQVDQSVNRDEGNNFEPKPEEQIKQTTSENYGDSTEHDDLGQMDASTDLDSKSQRGTLSNDIEQVDQNEKRDRGKVFKYEPEEGKQTTGENCGDGIEHDDLVELHSKSHGILSNDIEQVDQAEKMEEGKHCKSKPEAEIMQTTRGNCGESDPVSDGVEVPEMEANRSSSLNSLGADEIMEKNIMEVSKREALMEKDVADTLNSEILRQDNVDVLKYDQMKQFEEVKSAEISYGDSELVKDDQKFGSSVDEISPSESNCQTEKFGDSIKHDNFGKMDASMDNESKCQEETSSNDIEEVDEGEKRDDEKNFEPKPEEERKHSTRENRGDGIEHDDFGQKVACMDLDSKSQQGILSNDVEQVDNSEKMDEGKNFESKPEEKTNQTTRESCGDEETDSVFEEADMPELGGKSTSSFHSSGADTLMERNILEIASKVMEKSEKMDDGKTFESKPEEKTNQTIGESCWDEETDSVFEVDMPELGANSTSSLHSSGSDTSMERNILEITSEGLKEKSEKMGKNFESKPEEKTNQTTGESCGDEETDSVFEERDMPELGANSSSSLHSSIADTLIERNILEITDKEELMEKGEKMDEGNNFESKHEEKMDQTTGESCGDEETDSDFDEAEMPEQGANWTSSVHSSGANTLMERNILEITSKEELMEKNKTDAPTSERPGQATGGNIEYDNLGEMVASIDIESKSREVTLSNDINQVDQGEKRDEGKNFELKHEEEIDQATRENCGAIDQDLGEVDAIMHLDSKSLQGTLSKGIEQVVRSEKMDEESDSVFDRSDMPELVANRSMSLHSSRGSALVDKSITDSPTSETPGQDTGYVLKDDQVELFQEIKSVEISNGNSEHDSDNGKFDIGRNIDDSGPSKSKCQIEKLGDSIKHDDFGKMDASMDHDSKSQEGTLINNIEQVGQLEKKDEGKNSELKTEEGRKQTSGEKYGNGIKHDNMGEMDAGMDQEFKSREVTLSNDIGQVDQGVKMDEGKDFQSKPVKEIKQTTGTNCSEESDPVVNAAVEPKMEAHRSRCLHSSGADDETEGSVQPEKATTFRNLVKGKGIIAVSTFLRAFSGKFSADEKRDASDLANDREVARASPKTGDRSVWNPLNYIIPRNVENKIDGAEAPEPLVMKGRIILYTRLGCQSCKEVRSFLYNKRLRYVEINIDVYPTRKRELEKFAGSCGVPKVFFNEIVIGGLSELRSLDESGKLEEKIDFLINEEPAYEAPLPPLSGEDDMSSSGTVDELVLVVRKMKESIVVKDRFYKMRRFSKCFLGSEAVNFLSEDQYLEREEAIEFGRKLASKLFFQHVLDENLFEDGNHLYWFLDDNPNLSSQCHNIPRGIIEAKPKPIREIASRLRFLSNAIYEAYTSEDGKHVDYRTIHGSEEFARYLRIIQELQRVEFQDIPREEKLAFFINLFNMMIIHAILVLGHPDGTTERRKFLGDFKYVIGGYPYSLSAIQNGVLRCNQRPPFAVMKPFGNDRFFKAVLPYPEPLIHFALCLGTRSGPALQCYSPGNIDKELMDSARNFLRGGGLTIDLDAKVAYLSKILKWFRADFGENEVEVLKHASNYMEPTTSEALLELLQDGQLKVTYQPYDWGLNL